MKMEKIEYLTIRIENPFEMLGFIVYLDSKDFTVANLGNTRGLVHLCNLNRWLFVDLESKMVLIGAGDEKDCKDNKFCTYKIFNSINDFILYLNKNGNNN